MIEMECELGLCVKFKSVKRIAIRSRLGKSVEITVQPYEYIDIDVSTGKFFVKNKFTNSKIKLVSPDTDVHHMDSKKINQFLDLVKRSEGVLTLRK